MQMGLNKMISSHKKQAHAQYWRLQNGDSFIVKGLLAS